MLLKVEATGEAYNVDQPAERARMQHDLDMIGFFDVPGYRRHLSTLASQAPGTEKIKDFMDDLRLYSQAIYKDKKLN